MYRTAFVTLPNQLALDVSFEINGHPDIFTVKASSLFPRQDLLPDSATPVMVFDAHILDLGQYRFIFIPEMIVAIGGKFGWLYYDEAKDTYLHVMP